MIIYTHNVIRHSSSHPVHTNARQQQQSTTVTSHQPPISIRYDLNSIHQPSTGNDTPMNWVGMPQLLHTVDGSEIPVGYIPNSANHGDKLPYQLVSLPEF